MKYIFALILLTICTNSVLNAADDSDSGSGAGAGRSYEWNRNSSPVFSRSRSPMRRLGCERSSSPVRVWDKAGIARSSEQGASDCRREIDLIFADFHRLETRTPADLLKLKDKIVSIHAKITGLEGRLDKLIQIANAESESAAKRLRR